MVQVAPPDTVLRSCNPRKRPTQQGFQPSLLDRVLVKDRIESKPRLLGELDLHAPPLASAVKVYSVLGSMPPGGPLITGSFGAWPSTSMLKVRWITLLH